MRILFLSVFLIIPAYAVTDSALQAELNEMAKADQNIRSQIGEHGWGNPPQALIAQMERVDKKNTARLKQIVQKHSWPTTTLVGESGVASAFLITQHSPDPEFQAQMLPLLKQSYLNADGISGQEFALLTDRVLVHNEEAQWYGTQLTITPNKMVFAPIYDEANIDKRRAEVGLPPLEEYKKLISDAYGLPVE